MNRYPLLMPDNHDKRQADLDWLYGRSSEGSAPGNEHAQPIPKMAPGEIRQNTPEVEPASSRIQEPVPAPRRVTAPRRDSIKKQRRPRPRKNSAKNFLKVILILLIAWVLYLIGVPVLTVAGMDSVDQPKSTAGSHPGTTFLLAGTDSREHLSEEDKVRLGTGNAEGSRADTIILLYRPPFGDSVMVSLPRDSYVEIPGYGFDKLNAAYAYGGPELLIQSVENATGVGIDGYLEIGFGGFSAMIDAVNGVDVCLDEAMQDERANIDLPAGCQTLNGQEALGYVRMRYSDPRGDIGRAERQREIIGKLGKKIASPRTLIDPIRYWQLNSAIGKTLTKGDETSVPQMAAGALGVLGSAKDGNSFPVPISDAAGWSPEGASVVIWDNVLASELFEKINQGDTSDLERFKPKD